MPKTLPESIERSKLWQRLAESKDLRAAIEILRTNAEALAGTINASVPNFTDHSIRHMDALWGVTEQVLNESEIASISVGEAFVLAATFYLHDIGMALAANAEGLAKVRDSEPYKSFIARVRTGIPNDDWEKIELSVEPQAIAYAVRKLHAVSAELLATAPIPGTNRYLLEPHQIREIWAPTIGRVAVSHHWNLDDIEREFGYGMVPLADVGKGDLAFVACLLRLIDFAHINRDRAPTLDRALRQPLGPESLRHWLAQEKIDGPVRIGNDLVYRSSSPIDDVDTWWLYYEMLKGLDAEITAVRRYLDRKQGSAGRLSLERVRGASSPEDASKFIVTAGFSPVEINIRAGSIERLVQLLGGQTLYGANPMAAVRELIQNAYTAVSLKEAVAKTDIERAALALPIVLRLITKDAAFLEVTDHGVGMSKDVMTDYLVSIASDYWNSDQFFADFREAIDRGFRPAGKFGIGFVSIFMLGDQVQVESNRGGGARLRLTLRGVGRRGELRELPPPSGSGSTIKVMLKQEALKNLDEFAEKCAAFAPMLSHDLRIEIDGAVTQLPRNWWRQPSPEKFAEQTVRTVLRIEAGLAGSSVFPVGLLRRGWRQTGNEGPPSWPESWPEWLGDDWRLVAHPQFHETLLCLNGLALTSLSTPGFTGLFNSHSTTPDVSRSRALDFDRNKLMRDARSAVRPKVIENLNVLAKEGFVTGKLEFLARCASCYGREVVLECDLPWISIVRPPGEVALMNCKAILPQLARAKRVTVAFSTGPWTAMRRWSNMDPKLSDNDVAVVLDETRTDSLPYESEAKVGALRDVWPRCTDAPLFDTLIRLVGEAWQTAPDDLTKQNGWELRAGTLFGEFQSSR